MILDRVGALFALLMPDFHLASAEPLSGGLSNRCWKVELRHLDTGQCHTLVWRPHSAASRAFAVSRQHEYDVLDAIQSSPQHFLAPAPFAKLTEGLLVEWLDGKTATSDLPLSSLMALQAAIHQLPLPSPRLDPRQRGAHYWQFIGAEKQDPQLQRIHAYFQSQPVQEWFAETCCHHDLGCYNIIIAPDGQHRVIDWEYAAAGDPSLDLALTIAANQLVPAEAIDEYCRQTGIVDADILSRWHGAVRYWQPWCDYLALLWFYVGANQWQLACQQENDGEYMDQALSLQEKLWNSLQFSD